MIRLERLDHRRARIPRERIRHLAARIHDLGPRPLAELLIEFELEEGGLFHQKLEQYTALPADFIEE
jgi:hypothetical protein